MRFRPLIIASLLAAVSGIASAQSDYPNRPVNLIVPFAAGGGVDNVARAIAAKVSETLGQTVVVENRLGAGGLIATDYVSKAAPDGYTLLMATQTTLAVAPILNRPQTPDLYKTFAGVGLVANAPMLLVVNPQFAARNVGELIEMAKKTPGKIDYGSGGVGTTPHVAAELFALSAGIKLTHVAYKGEQPALTDVVGNQIPVMFSNLQAALPMVQGGRLRALAISTAKRSPTAPDIPTIAESGVAGFDAATWFGVVAPKGTPKPIIDKLGAEIGKAVDDARFRSLLEGQGLVIQKLGPQAFDTYIDGEYGKWRKVIQQAKITAQ